MTKHSHIILAYHTPYARQECRCSHLKNDWVLKNTTPAILEYAHEHKENPMYREENDNLKIQQPQNLQIQNPLSSQIMTILNINPRIILNMFYSTLGRIWHSALFYMFSPPNHFCIYPLVHSLVVIATTTIVGSGYLRLSAVFHPNAHPRLGPPSNTNTMFYATHSWFALILVDDVIYLTWTGSMTLWDALGGGCIVLNMYEYT